MKGLVSAQGPGAWKAWAFLAAVLCASGAVWAGDIDVYLTRAKVVKVKTREGKEIECWAPTTERIAYAWYDQPFAIVVEFDAETTLFRRKDWDGRVLENYATKGYRIWAHLRGFQYKVPGREKKATADIHILNRGRFKTDGTWARHDEVPITRGSATLVNRDQTSAGEDSSLWWGFCETPGGRFAAWAVCAADLRLDHFHRKAWDQFGSSVTGTLVVKALKIQQGEEGEVGTKEISLQIRQNGWRLRKVEEKKQGDWNSPLMESDGRSWSVQDKPPELRGATLTCEYQISGRPVKPNMPQEVMDFALRVEFPLVLWDHSENEFKLRVGQERSTGPTVSGRLGMDSLRWSLFRWPADKRENFRAAMENPFSLDPKEDPRTRLRSDEQTWYCPRAKDDGPSLRGYSLPDRNCYDPFQPISSHRLMEIRYGHVCERKKLEDKPVKAIGLYAARLSEVEDNSDGNISDGQPGSRLDLPTDGYAPWLEKHGELVRENLAAYKVGLQALNILRGLIDAKDKQFLDSLRITAQSFLWEDPDAGGDFIEDVMRGVKEDAQDVTRWVQQQKEAAARFQDDVAKRLKERLTSLSAEGAGAGGVSEKIAGALRGFATAPLQAGEVPKKLHEFFANRSTAGPRYETLSASALADLKAQRERLQKEINELRNQQKAEIENGKKLYQEIADSVLRQWKKEGFRHTHLEKDHKFWEEQSVIKELEMYEAAGMWQEMKDLLFRTDLGSQAVRELALLLEAKRELALGKMEERKDRVRALHGSSAKPMRLLVKANSHKVNAWKSLTDCLKVNPNSPQAKEMLDKIEITFLNDIARKLWEERRASDAALRRYISERGMDPDKPQEGWSGAWETLRAAWGSGPGATVSGWTALAEAETHDIIQTNAARNSVTMMAIIRLRDNGLSMSQIRNVSEAALKQRMSFATPQRREYPPDRLARMAQDIRETFAELPELKAMAEGDEKKLLTAMTSSYYRPDEVSSSWPEFIGDIFSPSNLWCMFGSFGVAKVGGKMQYVQYWDRSKGIAILGQSRGTQYAGDFFCDKLRVKAVGEWFLKSKVGQPAAWLIRQDMQRLGKLGELEQIGTSMTRMAAAMVIFMRVEQYADENNMWALSFFVNALAELGGGEIAYDIISRRGTPPSRILAKLDLYEEALKREKKALERREEIRRILAERNEKLKKAAAATPAGAKPESGVVPLSAREADVFTQKERDEISAIFEEIRVDRQDVVDGLNANADAQLLLGEAVNGLSSKNTKAVDEALESAGKLNKTQAIGLKEAEQRHSVAKKIVKNLDNTPQRPFAPMGSHLAPADNKNPNEWVPVVKVMKGGQEVEGRAYDVLSCGKDLKKGDEAFRRGDIRGARKHYERASLAATSEDGQVAIDLLNDRLNLCKNSLKHIDERALLRKTPRVQTVKTALGGQEAKVTDFIEDDEVEKVMEKVAKGELTLEYSGAMSANPVFFVKDPKLPDVDRQNVLYVFKAPAPLPGGPMAGYTGEMNGEELGSLLTNLAGEKAAGARRATLSVPSTTHTPTGQYFEGACDGILVRFIHGKEFEKLGEDVLVAVKADYARQRVIRAWLGDFDAHLRNSMLGVDGEAYLMDTGLASWTRAGSPMERMTSAKDVDTPEKLIDQAFGRSAVLAKIGHQGLPGYDIYMWAERMGDMTHYDDMFDTVTKINELVKDKAAFKEQLARVFRERKVVNGKVVMWTDMSKVDEAFEVLSARAAALEECLTRRFGLLTPGRSRFMKPLAWRPVGPAWALAA